MLAARLPFAFICLVLAGLPAFGQKPKSEVSYTHDIAPLVTSYCATCHRGDEPEGDLALETFEQVRRAARKGELLARIDDDEDPMPPVGLMSERQRALLRAWAKGGYVEKGKGKKAPTRPEFRPPTITPVPLKKGGFGLLQSVAGHWSGDLDLMGQKIPWFTWDFRAIAPAHVHAIYEGGSMGNIFTSFFVADFRGVRTVMARNGGILKGQYRTSYFVLDRVTKDEGATRYRLVDAYGGAGIMSMTLEFRGDRMVFTSHTSRFGVTGKPKLHMKFNGRRAASDLATTAAKTVGFPKKDVANDFSLGLPRPDWGPDLTVTSASYIWEGRGGAMSLETMGRWCGDPIRIDQMPHLGRLALSWKRPEVVGTKKIDIYLSREPFTDEKGRLRARQGVVREELLGGVLMYSEMTAGEKEMTFTYLHPGTYYVTLITDLTGEGYPTSGDAVSASRKVVVPPRKTARVEVPEMKVRR